MSKNKKLLMTLKKTYINRIATVFLVFYSFFLIFAAFHTHKINLQNGNSYRLERSKNSEEQTDPFLDENSKCRLYYFASEKFLFTASIFSSNETPQTSSNQINDYSNLYLTKYFFNIDLRAPPLS